MMVLSMEYGIPDERGLRCAYHGWLFDAKGRCLEQPFEDRTLAENRYKDKVTIKAYPVAELGGLIFAYLGPEPVPLVPRWDILVRDRGRLELWEIRGRAVRARLRRHRGQ